MQKAEALTQISALEEAIQLLSDQQNLLKGVMIVAKDSAETMKRASLRIEDLLIENEQLMKLVEEYRQSESVYQVLLKETEPLIDRLEMLQHENELLKTLNAELQK